MNRVNIVLCLNDDHYGADAEKRVRKMVHDIAGDARANDGAVTVNGVVFSITDIKILTTTN